MRTSGAICLGAERVEGGRKTLIDGITRDGGCHGCERYSAELCLANVTNSEDTGDWQTVLEQEGQNHGCRALHQDLCLSLIARVDLARRNRFIPLLINRLGRIKTAVRLLRVPKSLPKQRVPFGSILVVLARLLIRRTANFSQNRKRRLGPNPGRRSYTPRSRVLWQQEVVIAEQTPLILSDSLPLPLGQVIVLLGRR